MVKEGLFSGLAVAAKLGSPELLASVQAAFVDGMNAALIVGAGIAVVGFVLTLIFLPSGRKAAKAGRRRRSRAARLVIRPPIR